ncbi:MAG: phosphate ABC transporter, permease protein [Osedax symbiont Rs2]|nr:MAG: phosphate ABC transporter, permease protein [Osedax symbiont Rs2]
MKTSVSSWVKSGSPWIWLNAGAVAISVIMVVSLIALIGVRGLAHFWPANVLQATYSQGGNSRTVIGEIVQSEQVSAVQLRDAGIEVAAAVDSLERKLLKTGNRDIGGIDFTWVLDKDLSERSFPPMLFTAERYEWGNFYGFLRSFKRGDQIIASYTDNAKSAEYLALWEHLQQSITRASGIRDKIYRIEKDQIGRINHEMERLRLEQRRWQLQGIEQGEQIEAINQRRQQLDLDYKELEHQLIALYNEINRDSISAQVSSGEIVQIEVAKLVRVFRANDMNQWQKSLHYLEKVWEFVSEDPREANTEGGIFPAIFGTVMMVILMSIMVTPFGVVAAVYLSEYAKQGFTTRLIRIAVNNLAGVPSIVYGVFGLGFFVYMLGGSLDQLFYPEALPSPTFGTGGLLWASITLALLTVPVVIVATEEGLSRIPNALKEGSLALGATKAETLFKVILPMTSPAMMTGVILAIARAAGEVAPLMLVGVVKLAPTLPLNMNYPYLHLDQKIMHLGFHIYDVGFQSPNVEAARPLVYATAFLLILVIALLNLSAVAIRNRLREKYKALEV